MKKLCKMFPRNWRRSLLLLLYWRGLIILLSFMQLSHVPSHPSWAKFLEPWLSSNLIWLYLINLTLTNNIFVGCFESGTCLCWSLDFFFSMFTFLLSDMYYILNSKNFFGWQLKWVLIDFFTLFICFETYVWFSD